MSVCGTNQRHWFTVRGTVGIASPRCVRCGAPNPKYRAPDPTHNIRWSSTVGCPRKAIYGATLEPDRDWTDREERILYRGRSLGRDYADWLASKFGEKQIRREVKIKWAMGLGHMDVFVVPTETAIEVLSSAHASDSVVQRKLLQLVGYIEGYPRAKNGLLVILNPSDFTEERIPVVRGTDAYGALVERMHERVAAVKAWADTGTLPDRVCAKPSDAIGEFCRHATTCFDGWEKPEPAALVDDIEARGIALALFHAKQEERSAAAELKFKTELRQDHEARLAALPAVEGVEGDIAIGEYLVKRVHVQRRPTLDVKKAELAGALNVEALSEFFKAGADYWTTAIERTDRTPAVPDFGNEAPWTDDDLKAVA